jgi:nucleotide-binding universal stress UspA family protein
MYRKLLVPLDGSEYSECTLDHVRQVVTAHKIEEVVLLTVVEPLRRSAVVYLTEESVEEVEKLGRSSISEYLQSTMRKLDLPAHVTTELVTGQPASEILDYIDKKGIDLVLMSTHGRSGPSRWLMGSTAERVLQRSPVPVLLIPSVVCRMRA